MSNKPDQHGFSFVEAMICVLLSGVLLGAGATLMTRFQSSFPIEQEKMVMRENMGVALDILVRELRDAGNDPNGVGIAGVTLVDSNGVDIVGTSGNGIRIRKDVNPPDDFPGGVGLSDPGEDITFTFNSSTNEIRRTDNIAGGGATALVDQNITGMTFSLLTATGMPASANDAVAVRVTIQGRSKVKDPRKGQYALDTVTSDLRFRRR